jgi:hypothetical protein
MADTSLKALTSIVYTMAEKTQKGIQEDVAAIRKSVCEADGILSVLLSIKKSVDDVNKKGVLSKLGSGGKFSSRNMDKLFNRLIKSTDSITKLLDKIYGRLQKMETGKGGGKKDKRLERRDERNKKRDARLEHISQSIDIIERLSKINIKDFIFAKTKMKHISRIMERFKNMFKMFKNKKEMESTVEFASSAIEIVQKLSKIALLGIPARLGVKAIEKVFLGGKKGGGLLAIFRKVNEHKKDITQAKKVSKDMLLTAGALFLTSALLAGTAVVAVPAMIGALALRGIVWLLSGTFKVLNKTEKSALKGSVVLLIMSASIITFGLGIGYMAKSIRTLKWKDFGKLILQIAAFAVLFRVIGIKAFAISVAIGSAALMVMGFALNVFSKGLKETAEVTKGIKWKDFGNMVGQIFTTGLTVGALALMPIGPGVRKLKKMGKALGLYADSIEKWKKLGDTKQAVSNIENAISKTRDAIKGSNFDMKAVRQLHKVGKSLLKLYKGVKDWDKFNGKKAAANLSDTIGELKKIFNKDNNTFDKKNLKTFRRVGGILRRLYKGIQPWENLNSEKATENLRDTIGELRKIFNKDNNTFDKKNLKTFRSVGRILRRLYNGTKPWENLNSEKATTNLKDTIGELVTIFKENTFDNKKNLKTFRSVGRILRRLYKGVKPWENLNATQAANNLEYTIGKIKDIFEKEFETNGAERSMNTLIKVTNMSTQIMDSLKTWGEFKPIPALENIGTSVNSLLDIFGMNDEGNKKEKTLEDAVNGKSNFWNGIKNSLKKVGNNIASAVEQVSENAKTAARNNGVEHRMLTLRNIMESLDDVRVYLDPWQNENTVMGIKSLTKAVNAINILDTEKATVMIELFKSFSSIGKRPFDGFSRAVNRFSKSCNNLIDALNNFEPIEGGTTTTNENGETTVSSGSINIQNTEALAQALAEAIKSLPINVNANMSDIRLVVNGESGRKVILSLEN